MSNLKAFFNTSVVFQGELKEISKSEKVARYFYGAGSICFGPIRFLFNGKEIRLIKHEKEGNVSVSNLRVASFGDDTRFIKFIKTLAAIIAIIPLTLLGTLVKGVSYAFKSIQETHKIVVKHYTPLRLFFGFPHKRLPLDNIDVELKKIILRNPLNQTIKSVVIFAERNTVISSTSNLFKGLITEGWPQLILVDAKLESSDPMYEEKGDSSANPPKDGEALPGKVLQWKMNSVAHALMDRPLQGIKRKYFVETPA